MLFEQQMLLLLLVFLLFICCLLFMSWIHHHGSSFCRLPEHEWPHPGLLGILKSARQQRHVQLATQSVPFDRKLLRKLTFEERDSKKDEINELNS